MSTLAGFVLVGGALLIGVIAQFIGDVKVAYHWAVVALAALVGGWLGSEALGTFSTWGPEFEGLFIAPALLGGLILGTIVDVLLRYSVEGGYRQHPEPI
jgi:hypothetical protein